MADSTVSMSQALMVNAGVMHNMGVPTAPSLSSSSSCISSVSPTSSSFGSTGSGSVQASDNLQCQVPQVQNELKGQDTDTDDSTTNVNTISTPATSSAVNCTSSGEPGSSDGDHRGPSEDIITHLNMLSMQDGLGFNGFGLLGSGVAGGGNVWTPPTIGNMPMLGNGLNRQAPNMGTDHQPINVANYLEVLNLHQHLQLQQLKSGGLQHDILSNFFAGSNNMTPNIFGAQTTPIAAGLQQNSQAARRPTFGASGINGNFPTPYGNYFMNHAPPAVNFPMSMMDSGASGRGKPFTTVDNDSSTIKNRQFCVMNHHQQRLPSASKSHSVGIGQQYNGGIFPPPTTGPPFGNGILPFLNGVGNPMDQCKATMLPHPNNFKRPVVPFLLQQQQNGSFPCGSSDRSSMMGSFDRELILSATSSLASLGSNATEVFSRKVFVGGLPPDIDEALFKRPTSTLKHSDSVQSIPSNFPGSGVLSKMGPTAPQQQGSTSGNEGMFSRKVFVGGLPMDISEEEICATFVRFGPVTVDWPHKAESKSYMPPKGYAFLIFYNENSVQQLIDCCTQKEEGRYYIWISSPSMRKEVQIRPWRLLDADYVLDPTLALDPRKTVFVGGVPRPLKAVELAVTMNRYFGGVCYTGIDTDPELKYPKGAGRVSFSNQQSYIAAISERFVRLDVGGSEKRVEIKPYVLDDQMCDECGGARCAGRYAPYFCANVSCLQYYCELCWQTVHSKTGRDFHKPLVKEGSDRPRAVPFRYGI